MGLPLSRALADYVVDWQARPWPIRWSQVFGRAAPLTLEIGFGNGAFLAEQGRAWPERDHVGIELSWTAARHLFRRLAAAELGNVRALLGDAEVLVRETFGPESLSEVIVNHPCPWPKTRHHERRLLTREFLALLAERMQPLARLTVVTDHADYAHWLARELSAQRALASCHATAEVPAIPGRTPTKYQLKAMAQGIPIHYFEWHKRAGAGGLSARAPEPAREIPMPTLTLSGAVPTAELFRGFRPAVFRERLEDRDQALEVVIKLQAVYRRTDPPPEGAVWLLETLVQEGRLHQQFAIDVVERGASLLLKPSGLGQPYPTHGVKRAIWCAGAWIQSHHPGLVCERESLGLSAPAQPWPAPAPPV